MPKQKDWENLESSYIEPIDVLNGLPYSEVSQMQQMLYHIIKRIEILEANINNKIDKLENDIILLKEVVSKK